MNPSDRIIAALSSLTIKNLNGSFVTCLHDEADGYAFKANDKWYKVGFSFANEIAGLGDINSSLL
jgi:hypothetical protein